MKMTKAILLIVSTFFILSLSRAKAAENMFYIEGRVYCDTCRVEFETKISEGIEGAEVVLKCKNINTEKETYSSNGKTDKDGWYKLQVKGDHANDVCEVSTRNSPRANCKEPLQDNKAKIVCASNGDVATDSRYANPIGYKIDKTIDGCKAVLEEMGYNDLDETP